jgi:hypothetical protein
MFFQAWRCDVVIPRKRARAAAVQVEKKRIWRQTHIAFREWFLVYRYHIELDEKCMQLMQVSCASRLRACLRSWQQHALTARRGHEVATQHENLQLRATFQAWTTLFDQRRQLRRVMGLVGTLRVRQAWQVWHNVVLHERSLRFRRATLLVQARERIVEWQDFVQVANDRRRGVTQVQRAVAVHLLRRCLFHWVTRCRIAVRRSTFRRQRLRRIAQRTLTQWKSWLVRHRAVRQLTRVVQTRHNQGLMAALFLGWVQLFSVVKHRHMAVQARFMRQWQAIVAARKLETWQLQQATVHRARIVQTTTFLAWRYHVQRVHWLMVQASAAMTLHVRWTQRSAWSTWLNAYRAIKLCRLTLTVSRRMVLAPAFSAWWLSHTRAVRLEALERQLLSQRNLIARRRCFGFWRTRHSASIHERHQVVAAHRFYMRRAQTRVVRIWRSFVVRRTLDWTLFDASVRRQQIRWLGFYWRCWRKLIRAVHMDQFRLLRPAWVAFKNALSSRRADQFIQAHRARWLRPFLVRWCIALLRHEERQRAMDQLLALVETRRMHMSFMQWRTAHVVSVMERSAVNKAVAFHSYQVRRRAFGTTTCMSCATTVMRIGISSLSVFVLFCLSVCVSAIAARIRQVAPKEHALRQFSAAPGEVASPALVAASHAISQPNGSTCRYSPS